MQVKNYCTHLAGTDDAAVCNQGRLHGILCAPQIVHCGRKVLSPKWFDESAIAGQNAIVYWEKKLDWWLELKPTQCAQTSLIETSKIATFPKQWSQETQWDATSFSASVLRVLTLPDVLIGWCTGPPFRSGKTSFWSLMNKNSDLNSPPYSDYSGFTPFNKKECWRRFSLKSPLHFHRHQQVRDLFLSRLKRHHISLHGALSITGPLANSSCQGAAL